MKRGDSTSSTLTTLSNARLVRHDGKRSGRWGSDVLLPSFRPLRADCECQSTSCSYHGCVRRDAITLASPHG